MPTSSHGLVQRFGIGLAMACSLAGCGPAATKGGFDSANPAARMYAMEQAAREGDQAAVPRIIEQLDSDDPAVRLMAIATLERLTGETYGYRHYDPIPVRREAIDRWVQAVDSGAIVIQPMKEVPEPASTPDAPAAEGLSPAAAAVEPAARADHG